MKRSSLPLILPVVLLGTVPVHAEERPNFDAYFDRSKPAALAASSNLSNLKAPSADGVATSFDPKRGVPTFLWAGKQQPQHPLLFAGSAEGVALWYVGAYAHRWNLPASTTNTLELAHLHDTGRGGIIVTFRQRFSGVEVFRSEVKILLTRSHELVAISGSPQPARAGVDGIGAPFKLTASEAIVNAFNDLFAADLKPGSVATTKQALADYQYFKLGPGASKVSLVEPFRAKKVFFAMPDRLVPAWYLEITARSPGAPETDAYAYVIAADDGRLLLRHNLTAYDVYNYRVWADASDGRPLDGPIADFTPNPAGVPNLSTPDFVAPVLIPMDGFNTPPNGPPDPWLLAEATQTLGNNADAYTDDDTPDGFSNGDLRATITAAGSFDRVYDVKAAPLSSTSQAMAVTTQLFYDVNWLHDWFYDSGFNEAAGTAQVNNYGRGGIEGDVLHVEAQDGAVLGSRNNANMVTPADGASPRMQMFQWDGLIQQSLVDLSTNTSLAAQSAAFGPSSFTLPGLLALVDDGAGTVTDGCEPIQNDISGKIAIIDRAACAFVNQAKNAQSAGAIGVIIANNIPGVPAPVLTTIPNAPFITIPVLSTTLEQGDAFKKALLGGPVNVKMDRGRDIERDGSIDNSLISHEWGHYLHHRLVQCGLQNCRGQSEGWADFTALQMMVRPDDDLDGTYAVAIYATAGKGPDFAYFGLRRSPYTTDLTRDGLTFKHIADGTPLPSQPLLDNGFANSEVHNTGEIWASMLFEGYVALLKQSKGASPRYTFAEARRLMSDYVVAGMKLTPIEPTFNEQRDAMLAAIYASEPLDMALFAEAFAKRGLGTCSVSPPKDTEDNTGLTESFTAQGNFAVLSLAVDDSVRSCDKDGNLDAEETGKVSVKVMNTGPTTLAGATVKVSTNTAGVSFPGGAQVPLPSLEPFATTTAKIDIALDASISGVKFLDLTADVANAAGCQPTQSLSGHLRINYDNLLASSSADDVESDITAWTATSSGASTVWAREGDAEGDHVWHGIDSSSLSDAALESPPLDVSATDPLVVSFSHRYSFQGDISTNFDGGVIEVSTDNGIKWEDISKYVDPGYGGIISNLNGSPLHDRMAFIFQNTDYPQREMLSLDLGKALAGKTIKLRFRIGADLDTGDFGWEIDDLVVQGLTNKPFTAVGPDTATCEHAPKANAGTDQKVPSGQEVVLDGSGSSDIDGDTLTFKWTQTAGPMVPIINPSAQKPTFLAPMVTTDTQLTFELAVSDATASDKDSVDIFLQAPVVVTTTGTGGEGGEGGGGGSMPTGNDCNCRVGGEDDSSSGGAFATGLLGAAMLLVRRRRTLRRL